MIANRPEKPMTMSSEFTKQQIQEKNATKVAKEEELNTKDAVTAVGSGTLLGLTMFLVGRRSRLDKSIKFLKDRISEYETKNRSLNEDVERGRAFLNKIIGKQNFEGIDKFTDSKDFNGDFSFTVAFFNKNILFNDKVKENDEDKEIKTRLIQHFPIFRKTRELEKTKQKEVLKNMKTIMDLLKKDNK